MGKRRSVKTTVSSLCATATSALTRPAVAPLSPGVALKSRRVAACRGVSWVRRTKVACTVSRFCRAGCRRASRGVAGVACHICFCQDCNMHMHMHMHMSHAHAHAHAQYLDTH